MIARIFSSKRKRNIFYSLLATVLVIGILTFFVLLKEKQRDTDLTDPKANITSKFMGSDEQQVTKILFTDQAHKLGITMHHGPGPRTRNLVEDTGSGIAWGDYDGDEDWDLYVVNFPGPLGREHDQRGSNRLYRNDGDHFTDVTTEARVGDLNGFGMGASFADYDNDGDTDLYVTNFGPNRLFQNQGDGTFEEVAEAAGVADPLWSTGAAWGDFNRDGFLDLYVCNYVDFKEKDMKISTDSTSSFGDFDVPTTLNPNAFDPLPNRLFKNRGDGTFEEVAESSEVANPEGRSFSAAFCDLDGDGWLDLYITNDVSSNKLYRNLGRDIGVGETVIFEDISTFTGTADPRGSMGLSIAEISNMTGESDGLPDLFVSHWVTQENAFYQSLITPGGGLEYRDKTRQFRLGEISIDTVGWGTALADFNNDGKIDIAVANGSTLEMRGSPLKLRAEPIFIFRNKGKQFYNIAPYSGEAMLQKYNARGLAVADFDKDGDVDIAISVNRAPPLLLRNETDTTNQSLTITLSGSPSVCFGARIEIFQKNNLQVRWWGADVTFMGMHAAEKVFGLGQADKVDKVRVLWADGKETIQSDVHAGSVNITHPGFNAGSERTD